MVFTNLISAPQLLKARAENATLIVIDCHFDLNDPDAGRRAYAAGHIPGAAYLHLDEDLSGSKLGQLGRHPLPAPQALRNRLNLLGIDAAAQVVAYDQADGMFAARLWWLLRWVGHQNVAVLDGGLPAWRAANGEVTTERSPSPLPVDEPVRNSLVSIAEFDEVLSNLDSADRLVLDARSPERFRGEGETLDPVGGHIPGAANRFFRSNLMDSGVFKAPTVLRAEFEAAIGAKRPDQIIAQCGSGVTACHNVLAMHVAGLPGAALYAGSWSEWSRRPDTPKTTRS